MEDDGGKINYSTTKFEEYKFKSIKRKKTTDYPDNLSDARCLKKISYRNLSFSFKKSFWSYCISYPHFFRIVRLIVDSNYYSEKMTNNR